MPMLSAVRWVPAPWDIVRDPSPLPLLGLGGYLPSEPEAMCAAEEMNADHKRGGFS